MNFSLVCSVLLERGRPDGEMTVILWKSVEMGDETSVVSLDCVIHRDIPSGYSGNHMKCRKNCCCHPARFIPHTEG